MEKLRRRGYGEDGGYVYGNNAHETTDTPNSYSGSHDAHQRLEK
jgi:hypothetical protein